jgi:hypothetical protein
MLRKNELTLSGTLANFLDADMSDFETKKLGRDEVRSMQQ